MVPISRKLHNENGRLLSTLFTLWNRLAISFSKKPWNLVDEVLNDYNYTLTAIYILYQKLISIYRTELNQSTSKIWQSLFYCFGLITVRPILFRYLFNNTYWPFNNPPRREDFVILMIRYGTEVLIPCYIWRPSQNERISYNEEELTESKEK
ncbi:hypothetical protein SOMG_04060 [Schizosaccharomyces osmophilus]|uniref:Uncharacterized protein n=1 Tax=Schizosaccharomyces osmophilus TaxID=2545709 RepID=A0AAE9WCX6_9SCHI|nr:uncharacterized protein SOMG_04060 [Schizosaccharomyces osmophilus]WBW73585.1 hypothetical protein SOMG_04060 [Schizosaccharomyces osmophilus]